MPLSSSRRLRIAEPTASPALSRARKQFNNLIKKLEAERLRLAAWHDTVPRLQAMAAQELTPLEETFNVHRKQLLILLDRAHSAKGIGKREREKLEDLIATTAFELLEAGPDDEVEEILNKFHDSPFGDEKGEELLRDAIADMFGLELDEGADLSSHEALLRAVSEKMAEQEQQAPPPQQAQAGGAAKRAKSAKGAKVSAREQRQLDETQRLQQSVRDIYRKLASALHPDRAPDEPERRRKTALMQRVNVAYENNDLLALLELQLEIEQIDQSGLDNLTEDRLKQFNKILTGQLRELEEETAVFEDILLGQIGLFMPQRPTPERVMRCLRDDIDALRRKVAEIALDLETFQDLKQLKAWLKTYRIPKFDLYRESDWY